MNHVLEEKVIRVELRTMDFLLIGYLALLSVLEFFFRRNFSSAPTQVAENFLVIALIPCLLWLSRQWPFESVRVVVRIAGTMAVTSFIYHQMGTIIHLFVPKWWDPEINLLETWVFGCHPNAWLQSFSSPWCNEAMMFAYVIYLPMIPAVAFICHRCNGAEGLERFLAELVLCFFLCYLCYMVFPVAGPSRALAAEFHGVADGWFFTDITNYMRANVHLPGGAFPSAHCAASTVLLAALARCHRTLFRACVPLVLLIYVSTMYGWFHYLTDVLAGIAVGCASVWITPKLQNAVDHGHFTVGFTSGILPASPTPQQGELASNMMYEKGDLS